MSHSDSDSDREPNSNGARVFWGYLKTPERSRSNFIDPPQTVVRYNKLQPTLSPSLRMQEDDTAAEHNGKAVLEGADDLPCLHQKPSTGSEARAMHESLESEEGNLESRDVQPPGVDAISNSYDIAQLTLFETPSGKSLFSTSSFEGQASDTGPECDVEKVAVRPPSPMCKLVDGSPLDGAHDLRGNSIVLHSKPKSPVSLPLENPAPSPHSLQFPDLISFDIPMRLSTDPPIVSLPQSSITTSGTGSCAVIDDFFTSSPQQTQRLLVALPSPPPVHFQSPGPQPVVTTSPPSSPKGTSLKGGTTMKAFTQLEMVSNQLSPEAAVPASLNETSSHKQVTQNDDTQGGIGSMTTPILMLDDTLHTNTNETTRTQTPKRTDNILSLTPGAETRKRTSAKILKDEIKAYDDSGGSDEPSVNASNESVEDSINTNQTFDKVFKKERRAKARQEAQCIRPVLTSLSPTSADMLHLLASPGRMGSTRPSPRTLGDLTSRSSSTNVFKNSKLASMPHAGPSTPARRIPITVTSPRRPNRPLHLDRPNPVHLDDPNRTPARRIPVPTPISRSWRPLPLDSPDRTPARRLAVVSSAPTEQVETAVIQDEGSHVTCISASPAKPATDASFSKTIDQTKLDDTVCPPAAPRAEHLQQPSDLSGLLSLPMVANSSPKRPPSSNVQKLSVILDRKIGRVVGKPSRLGYPQFKSRKPSSSRLPIPGASFGSTTSGASFKRVYAPSAAPTLIPSPVKRRPVAMSGFAPSAFGPLANMVTAKPSSNLTYKLKRRRMMAEDTESDEPPAKRPMVVIRQVTKGMFNKTAQEDPTVPDSTVTCKEAILDQPMHPPDTPHVPPSISTSEQIETSRSSSHEPMKNIHAETEPPSILVPVPSTPPRKGSPLADTDTASLTTLSREPTLDDMPISSSFPALGPEQSFMMIAEPEPKLRRTTRPRKSSMSKNRREPLPLITIMRRGSSSSKTQRSLTRNTKVPDIPINQRQLQALTQANTMHNQVYFSELQRKIVRKAGPRPASPSTKVKTILEKEKEAGAIGRQARAERRRRRGEGSTLSANSESDSFDFSSSPPRDVMREYPLAHVRGPGDEEDYETPERVPKPSRLYPGEFSKNVKWDRGLARPLSEFAAEQAAKKEREGAAADAIRKGCLVRDSKSLCLDPLGNVPNANTPLDNLGHKRVVVTRFIYDDDEDMEATRVTKTKKS